VKAIAHAGQCQVTLAQIEMWNENMNCPLDAEEAFSTPIITTKCDYKVGETASGYMVLQNAQLLTF
jgi:hypothetical protein